MRYCLLLLPLLALPALAADPPKHRADGDAAIAARRVLLEHCAACHGDPDPKKRQGRLDVHRYSELVGNAGKIPFASLDKEDLRSQVVEFMTDGSMPPGGRKAVPQEQAAAVQNWIKRGAPAYPAAFDDDAVLQLIADDIARVEKDRVPHVRYVSLAHLVDQKGADLAKAEAELFTALAGRTHGDKFRLTGARLEESKKQPAAGTPDLIAKAVKLVPGSAGTVYRLDMRELGWDGGGKLLFEVTKSGVADADGDFRMTPFDLVQLEYPYAHTSADEARKKTTDAAVAAMNAHRKGAKDPLAQLRAVPFVRGDWLAKALWQKGKPTPLADDLDSLGELAELLAKTNDSRAGTGPDFVPFAGGPKVPADATAPPVWAWYQPAVAPADPPFNFTFAVEGANPFRSGDSFKLIGDSDKPVAVSLVEVQVDLVDLLTFGDAKNPRVTLDVTKNTPIAQAANGRLSPTIIETNVGKPLFYLLFASPQVSPHREPVVVRSRHKASAVWRVLPNEADAAAGRGPPVRQVTRIEVVAKKKMD